MRRYLRCFLQEEAVFSGLVRGCYAKALREKILQMKRFDTFYTR